MNALRKVRLVGVAAGVAMVLGGCHGHFHGHFNGHGHGWHVDSCGGDGGLILLGVLGIAWGITAIWEACRHR